MTPTTDASLADRYGRIARQLGELMTKTADPVARMATAVALLHHKMPHYFWTGFYRLVDGALIVGPYQGPLACQVLQAHTGVCWAGIDRGEPVVVADVHAFPGHIACDSASRSEIVVPIVKRDGTLFGVLDLDSALLSRFKETEKKVLEAVVELLVDIL